MNVCCVNKQIEGDAFDNRRITGFITGGRKRALQNLKILIDILCQWY